MRDIRIGNDFTIKWSLYKNDGETRTPYEVTGAAVLKLCSAYGTREVYGWQASGNTIVWTFRGADQRHLGPYQLVYIENDGKPNMMTVDTCDAFCLVSQSCQQSDPSELLMLESDIVFAEVRMIDDELSATSLNAISNRAVTEALGKKVDAVPGKGLSTEDFTTADKTKLQSLENYNDAGIREALNKKQDAIPDLETIRQGAQKGATALQEHQDISHLATKQEVEDIFPMKMVTYADLVAMRDEGRLVPGQQYRIIDFVTTVDQADAKSAGHQFDVIVTADGPSVLNEKARAAISEGDTYFTEAGANLKAWQLWYSLDNDKSRFEWADATNGKGVIYRMIDEWQNDVPYDFKNVVYVNNEEDYAQYTFGFDRVSAADWETAEDESRHSQATTTGNVMLPYLYRPQLLNANLLYVDCSDNKFDANCHHNILGPDSSRNIFGFACSENNLLGGISSFNKFGPLCERITLGGENEFNSFGRNCYDIELGYYGGHNIFGDTCNNISLAQGASHNSFGFACRVIILGKNCKNNTLGQECYDTNIDFNSEYNVLGNNCSVQLGVGCRHNKIGNDCSVISLNVESSHNTIGNLCHDITMAGGSVYNSIGNNCYRITFRTEEFENNSIGDGCYDIVFGEYVYKLAIAQGCSSLHFESGCYNSSIGQGCYALEIGDCENVFIMAGVNGFASSDSSQEYFRDCFLCPDGSSYIEIPFKDIKIS